MTPESRPPVSPFVVLFLGIFAVSTSAVFVRLAQMEAAPLVVAAYRLVFASLILLPLTWQKRDEIRRLKKDQITWLFISGAFLAFHFAVWITSLAYTSVASSVVLVTTTPLWVGLFSPIFLKERISPRIWGGLLVALCGGVLVSLAEVCSWAGNGLVCSGLEGFFQGRAFLGNILALAGALLAAGYMLIGRKVRASLSLVSYISIVYGFAAILLVGMALLSGEALGGFHGWTYVWLLCLAAIPQLLGHTSYNFALGYLPAVFVSIAVLAEPVGATLLAIPVLGEWPGFLEVVGGVIILMGISLATWNGPKRKNH